MAGLAFDKNDKPRLKAQFVSLGGALNDPSAVTFKHKDPSGNAATLTHAAGQITRESTGIYYLDLALDEVGTWYFRAEGTGTPQIAAEIAFEVRTTQF